jgi:hypothetical protein
LDYHENAVAQASSLQADRMSALHFHPDGCANAHGNYSGRTITTAKFLTAKPLWAKPLKFE